MVSKWYESGRAAEAQKKPGCFLLWPGEQGTERVQVAGHPAVGVVMKSSWQNKFSETGGAEGGSWEELGGVGVRGWGTNQFSAGLGGGKGGGGRGRVREGMGGRGGREGGKGAGEGGVGGKGGGGKGEGGGGSLSITIGGF